MSQDENQLITIQSGISEFSNQFEKYLQELQLPEQGVLVSESERFVVLQNIPNAIERLTLERKVSAMYISKFIAACGAGLFDAALNFLWNEIITNLRIKVAQFDMNYFIDSVITDSKRKSAFKSESDLVKLDDWELVKGCKDTGIITDIGYRHLDYIRDMRNHASAAHPNHNDIDGLQLVSWLQTCIREVFAKDPEGPVLEVKRLLSNLRNHTLTEDDVPSIKMNIERMPVEIVDSCMRAGFGMYSDPGTDVLIRNNLKLIIKILWSNCSEEEKNNIGIKYAVFAGNAEIDRKQLTSEFLDFVSGKAYLPESEREIQIGRALDDLSNAHSGFNNFYSEPPLVRILSSYIGDTGIVPGNVNYTYVKVVVMCYIGNGYGVSSAAEPIYEELISKFTDPQVKVFLNLFLDRDFNSRLQFTMCKDRVSSLAERFRLITANERYKAILELIISSTGGQLTNIYKNTEFIKKVEQIN